MTFSQISHFSPLTKCFVPQKHCICTYAREYPCFGVKTRRKRCINYHSFSQDHGTIQLITKSTALLLSLRSVSKQILTRMNTKLTTQKTKPNHKWEVTSGLVEILVLTPKFFSSIPINALCSVLMRPAGWTDWRDVIRKKENTTWKDLWLLKEWSIRNGTKVTGSPGHLTWKCCTSRQA